MKIKYSKPGGLVEVRLDSPSNGRSTVVLEVRDNGIGIGSEDISTAKTSKLRARPTQPRRIAQKLAA